MLAPNSQVRFCHPRVGGKNEHDRMGLWNQADGQFRLGTNGVQPWRVQYHQALLEQRMGNVDQRMSPHRHFNQPVVAGTRVVVRAVVVPKAQRPRLIRCDVANLGHLFKGLGQLCSIVHVKVHAGPLFGCSAQLHQRQRLQTCLNRQQAQARRHIRIPAQLGRTHGGAPCGSRHDASAVTGKKDRVDQL